MGTPTAATRSKTPPNADAELRALLDSLQSRSHGSERRAARRYPYPYLVQLTPVGDDGVTAAGRTIVVVGKHLSESGLGFYHPGPLPYRRMVVLLETAGASLAFLIDVAWCRFLKQGWYESGGRFVQGAPAHPSGSAD